VRWVLAGGLNPSNIRGALAQSHARFVDVNSGVESSPGVKDPAKLAALAAALRSA
jgi:phosphoribosylanthranilate isomerase